MEKIEWSIPRTSGDPINITVKNGDLLFIVGANGSGKSALIQRFVSENRSDRIKRISAHRQTWLESGNIDITPANRENHERNRLVLCHI